MSTQKQSYGTISAQSQTRPTTILPEETPELNRFINMCIDNNNNIFANIDDIKKLFSRFTDAANRLNPDEFYKNKPENKCASECSEGRSPYCSGMLGELYSILSHQRDIIDELSVFYTEVNQHIDFFEKHI